MSNPLFLTGATESKVYSLGTNPYSGDASHTLTGINIPASTNTVVTAYSLDGVSASYSTIALTDGTNTIAPITTLTHRRGYTSDALQTIVAIYDVSGLGAITGQSTTTTSGSTTAEAVCMVLLSEGFFQSAVTNAGFQEEYDFSIYNPNAANSSVAQIILQDDVDDRALSGVTSPLFTVSDIVGEPTVSAHCVASYSSDVKQEYAYTNNGTEARRMNSIVITFSSQPDPFDGITGKLTSPIIK